MELDPGLSGFKTFALEMFLETEMSWSCVLLKKSGVWDELTLKSFL